MLDLIALQEVSSAVAFGFYCIEVEVSFARASGSENEAPYIVNFGDSAGNNGTNR